MFSFDDNPSPTQSALLNMVKGSGPELAVALIGGLCDFALIVSSEGLILSALALSSAFDIGPLSGWHGKRFRQIVSSDSLNKADDIVAEAVAGGAMRWRQVNHPRAGTDDLPVQYGALALDPDRLLLVGREMRSAALMQRRLLETQQAMERDYERFRMHERRFRLLFLHIDHAVLILNGDTGEIVDANPTAQQLLAPRRGHLVGQRLAERLSGGDAARLDRAIAAVAARRRSEQIAGVKVAEVGPVAIRLSPFGGERRSYLLVSLSAEAQASSPTGASPHSGPWLGRLADATSDGILVSRDDGEILFANRGFAGLVGCASELEIVGQSVDRWLFGAGLDMAAIATRLDDGVLRHFATDLVDEVGERRQIELSAARIDPETDGESAMIGFVLRDIGRRPGAALNDWDAGMGALPDLSHLVGQLPLKDIVRETTGRIESICIDAALEMTRGNRASAAELLGLSRQSLYVKLRRLRGDEADFE